MNTLSKLKVGDRGKKVVLLQESLITSGYRVKADGILGPVTWDFLDQFAEEHELRWDKDIDTTVGDELSALLMLAAMGPAAAPSPANDTPLLHFAVGTDTPSKAELKALDGRNFRVIDISHEQSQPIPRSKKVRGRTLMRAPADVTGICMHQMACNFGVTAQAVRDAGGDRDLARARRMLNVPAHACSMTTGSIAVHSPVEALLHHGHGFNDDTLGLEIEGLYAGVAGVKSTMWKPERVKALTYESVLTARGAMTYLTLAGRAAGMRIQYVYGHRQTHLSKSGDPGSEIWQQVVLAYGVPVLGLETRNEHTRRDGVPIPRGWDPASSHKYR